MGHGSMGSRSINYVFRHHRLTNQSLNCQVVGEEECATFAETRNVPHYYFVPKSNVPFKEHSFKQIASDRIETVDQFVCRLRQQAARCDFGLRKDDYINDIIAKCYSSHLRRKLLELEGSVTLHCLLKIAN